MASLTMPFCNRRFVHSCNRTRKRCSSNKESSLVRLQRSCSEIGSRVPKCTACSPSQTRWLDFS